MRGHSLTPGSCLICVAHANQTGHLAFQAMVFLSAILRYLIGNVIIKAEMFVQCPVGTDSSISSSCYHYFILLSLSGQAWNNVLS